ncbi:hypothetical protein [Rhizobium sp.]|uniref:hypothetical protein n=1 Tax=Rhizobium sp. TaxID=391 RepID=UPI0028ADD990
MARVRFTHDFDYKPTPQSTIGYKAGMELTVKRECADQAVAAGKAHEITAISGKTDDGAE